MPVNKFYLTIPEIAEPRRKLKEELVRLYGRCELTGKCGILHLHEGLIECGQLRGLERQEIDAQIAVWKVVLLHPANVFLLNGPVHLNKKPSRAEFLKIVLNRSDYYYQEYPLPDWRFKTAQHAKEHFYLLNDVFHEQGIFKVKIGLPIL